jgi:hypothetical protein
MNLIEIKKKITSALMAFEDIFDESQRLLLRSCTEIPSRIDSIKYLSIYWPKRIDLDSIDGLKLKDNKGFISISEKYKYTNNKYTLEMVAYTYRYITQEMEYKCKYYVDVEEKKHFYNFHYDMDFLYQGDDEHHSPHHLQVFHSRPRFKTEEISIFDFVKLIRDFCYEGKELKPYTGSFLN